MTTIEANTCHVVISEGKYHQIKRMFHHVGNEVLALQRIRIGNLQLADLMIDVGECCVIEKT